MKHRMKNLILGGPIGYFKNNLQLSDINYKTAFLVGAKASNIIGESALGDNQLGVPFRKNHIIEETLSAKLGVIF